VDETTQSFEDYIAELIHICEEEPDVIGLVLFGSTADRSRMDEWSDHDFAVVTRSGAQSRLRGDLRWLPRCEELVLSVQERHGGFKAVYEDGHVIEFAVVDSEELREFHANAYRVAYGRSDVAEIMAEVAARPKALAETDDAKSIRIFLALLLIGCGRARRGEALSAGQTIRSEALDHLLPVLAHRLGGSGVDRLDSLDARRRFESVFPEAGATLTAALERSPETCARALLELSCQQLQDGWDDYPAAAADVVRRRLGWSVS